MTPHHRPMTNLERQRRFQEAHPGYDRRRKAHRRAMLKRGAERQMAELKARLARASETRQAPPQLIPPLTWLALPCPQTQTVFTPMPELPPVRERERVAA